MLSQNCVRRWNGRRFPLQVVFWDPSLPENTARWKNNWKKMVWCWVKTGGLDMVGEIKNPTCAQGTQDRLGLDLGIQEMKLVLVQTKQIFNQGNG